MKLSKTIVFTLTIPHGLDPEQVWEEFKEEFDFSNGEFYPEGNDLVDDPYVPYTAVEVDPKGKE